MAGEFGRASQRLCGVPPSGGDVSMRRRDRQSGTIGANWHCSTMERQTLYRVLLALGIAGLITAFVVLVTPTALLGSR